MKSKSQPKTTKAEDKPQVPVPERGRNRNVSNNSKESVHSAISSESRRMQNIVQQRQVRNSISFKPRISSAGSYFQMKKVNSGNAQHSASTNIRGGGGRHEWENINRAKIQVNTNIESQISEVEETPVPQPDKLSPQVKEPAVNKKVRSPLMKKRNSRVERPAFQNLSPARPVIEITNENTKSKDILSGGESKEVTSGKRSKDHDKEGILDQIEVLQENFEEILLKTKDNTAEMEAIKKSFDQRAKEKTMAQYLDMISDSLQKECGEKPYSSKMTGSSMMQQLYQSEDSLLLKESVQKMVDKMQIIGMNLINAKKYKKQSQAQIFQLEEQVKTFIRGDVIREQQEEFETSIKTFVNAQVEVMMKEVSSSKEELFKKSKEFEEKMSETQKETLWKIKDVESLMATRISEEKVNTIVQGLDKKLYTRLLQTESDIKEKLDHQLREIQEKVDIISSFAEKKHNDLRIEVKQFSSKIEKTVEVNQFNSAVNKIDNIKTSLEMELDLMQSHIRESKDKQAELIKRFQLIVDKLTHEKEALGGLGADPMALISASGSAIAKQKTMAKQANSDLNSIANSAAKMKEVDSAKVLPKASAFAQKEEKDEDDDLGDVGRSSQQLQEEIKEKTGNFLAKRFDGIQLLKTPSIRDQANLSRKGRNDLIDKKMIEFEDNMEKIEMHLQDLQRQLDEKPDQDIVDLVRDDKVSKSQFLNMIPKYLTQKELDDKINKICDEKNTDMSLEFEEIKKSVDQKVVKVRQEFDIGLLRRMIERKADNEEIQQNLELADVKITTLDTNFLLLAKDFETFQKVLNKMHTSILELQEVNKDVLLGKKNVNCLSCNKGKDGFEALTHVKGQDGRLYIGSGAGPKQSTGENLNTDDNLRMSDGLSLIDNIHQPNSSVIQSPQDPQIKPHSGFHHHKYNSLSLSMRGAGYGSKKGSILINEYGDRGPSNAGAGGSNKRVLVNRNAATNQSVARSGSSKQQSMQNLLVESIPSNKQAIRGIRSGVQHIVSSSAHGGRLEMRNKAYNRSMHLNTTSAGSGSQNVSQQRGVQSGFNKRSKLPIGFMVQQEMKNEFISSHLKGDQQSNSQTPQLKMISEAFQGVDTNSGDRNYGDGMSSAQRLLNRNRPMTSKIPATSTFTQGHKAY